MFPDRDRAYPLYDERYEHDACGVGFVADAGGRSHARILPLALAGLAALGHRGAFAADGASSDGAGVLLPLEPSILGLIDPQGHGLRGVIALFLPGDPSTAEAARRRTEAVLARAGLPIVGWRRVPVDAAALGPEARASLPLVIQAVVRLSGSSHLAAERRLLLARRELEIVADREGWRGYAVVSASTRTVVYKGLVAGSRLSAFYPDLADPSLSVSHAVFHQRYATNTSPTWNLAQPFRHIAHNGEINTVRANREALRGRAARLGGAFGRRMAALGPLLDPHGSDSQSLDEVIDLLVASGWSLPRALLLAMPEAPGLRADPLPEVTAFQQRTAGLMAPWDGPAAIAFSDGRRVGAILDRNGLRPLAVTMTHDGIVAAASEAGAVPIAAAETAQRRRLGPGELLLVEPAARRILLDTDAKRHILAPHAAPGAVRPTHHHFTDRLPDPAPAASPTDVRWIAGLDGERFRLDIRTMALEGHEPLWSMGDDTPLPGLSHVDRRVADHLRQSFAQVTNPPIDPERERVVMDLSVELGRRAPLLGTAAEPSTMRLDSPVVADLDGLTRALAGPGYPAQRQVRTLDGTWSPSTGADGLERALDRLATQAVAAARRGSAVVVVSDRHLAGGRLPVPSVLAVGAVHTALADAGLRGTTDLVAEASDLLDIHATAMVLAAGARAVVPWLAIELAGEQAGSRGAEDVTRAMAVGNLVRALGAGLRKVLARMGISCLESYVGGQLFEILELDRALARRCFPAAPIWPGSVDLATIAERQIRRSGMPPAADREPGKFPDPGRARFRGDGERHLNAPATVKAIQALVVEGRDGLPAYRAAIAREPATVRDQLRIMPAVTPVRVAAVESEERILRRFVGAAMSLGALSPEAHQAITIGLRRIGAAANTGEGGEDPAWYLDDGSGKRHDSQIKQVASGRFGVTAEYLARAEQLEIKIAQGSKPGEGGQLPARKVTAHIAMLRRGRPGRSMISPPPHHDIYSIEDLAQLIADLRAIDPGARIGVKLVAALGIGAIAAGVAKAGADYIQVSGHSGGTGASPLSSIKHAGIPWELGLAEVHQTLMRNGLRDRVALRTDGGLQTGRDVLVAALLGAEEFGFGTAALIAVGCDMARQCHLDTCPTGVATQREDLRAKFTGTPEQVERLFHAIAADVRESLAAAGLASIGEAVGRTDLLAVGVERPTLEFERLLGAPAWPASADRRSDPAHARKAVAREPASAVEAALAEAYYRLPAVRVEEGPPRFERAPAPAGHIVVGDPDAVGLVTADVTNADRSFGAHVSGLRERGTILRSIRWRLDGAAGQSFGAFATSGVELTLVGQANDYVGKGLSGGHLVVRPETELLDRAFSLAIAGNTCLYGATGGTLHVVGRAGMRFAVRNSGASAVVEGVGAHGCEYMTGGIVLILGSVGQNLAAGMSGGRIYLHDPEGTRIGALDRGSARAIRLGEAVAGRADGMDRLDEVRKLLMDHRAAGSALARRLMEHPASLAADLWLIESMEDKDDLPMEPDAPSEPTVVDTRTQGSLPSR